MSCDKLYLRKDLITCDPESGVSLKDLLIQIINDNPQLLTSVINNTIIGGGGSDPLSLDDLTDVTAPLPADGDLLYRTPSEWINTPGIFNLLKYQASTVSRQSNPNVTMGSVGSTYVFEGKTLQELIEDMFFVYQAPAFTTFNYFSTPRYIGEPISGVADFTWSYTNPNNVSGGFTITNVTGGNSVLYTNITPTDLTKQHTQTFLTKYAIQSHRWKIEGTNTQGSNFSRNYDIQWGVKILSCVGDTETFQESYLVDTGIPNYTSANLLPSSNVTDITTSRSSQIYIDEGDQGLTNGSYKYILVPIESTYNATTYTLLDTSGISFTNTALSPPFNTYAMDESGTLTIDNEYGVTITYQVYRSVNPSFASFNIQIS